MKRTDEFIKALDELLDKFSDLHYGEIADELDYRANKYYRILNKEN